MIIEINYIGNEANTEPQTLDDIKIMAIDTQTKQLIDDLKEEVADLDSRLDAVEEGGGGSGGGSELPTPTAADAGKAITVDSEGGYALTDIKVGTVPFITFTGVGAGTNSTSYNHVNFLLCTIDNDNNYSEISFGVMGENFATALRTQYLLSIAPGEHRYVFSSWSLPSEDSGIYLIMAYEPSSIQVSAVSGDVSESISAPDQLPFYIIKGCCEFTVESVG